jgi:hypothetical protein
MLEESNSKKAIIGSVLAMLAGAGLLTKDLSFDQIKSKANQLIDSGSSQEKKDPLEGKKFDDIVSQVNQTSLEKTAKDLGVSERSLLDWIIARSPKDDPNRKRWTQKEIEDEINSGYWEKHWEDLEKRDKEEKMKRKKEKGDSFYPMR